ncbi:MAG: peptidylprolyl isomerase [Sphingobacteriaceae bacterium]|nr:peptidylprolyl isomerase [Sphingobacteriaceae bacterium]
MKKILFTLAGLFCLVLTAQAQKKVVDKIVAKIGDNLVLLSDVNQQYSMYLSQGNAPDEKVKCYILQQILSQKLLKQQAEIDSIEVDDSQVTDEVERRMRYQMQRMGGQENLEKMLNKSVLQYKEEIRPDIKEQLRSNKMQAKITENLNVTPNEVKKYFESIKKDSLPDIGAEVEIGEIVLYPKLTKAEKQKIRDKIEALRLRVKSGEDFSFLAKTYSEDPGSAPEGGDLGFFDRTVMAKEFTAMAFKLKAGDISPVFETEFGFHFLEVLERRGEQVHVRHLLLRPQNTVASLERVKLQADSLVKKINDKQLTFPVAAASYSESKDSKFNGGIMLFADNVTARTTFIPVDKVDPKVFAVIDTMKVGDISKATPFREDNGKEGYKIFWLKDKIAPHKANLDQDFPKFREKAQQEKNEKALSIWFEKRRETTSITIDEEFLSCDEMKVWIKNK